jgi:hypothetical protein
MKLPREGELVLEVLDDLQAACNVDRVIIVWKPSIALDWRALHCRIAKELGKKIGWRYDIRWSDTHFAIGILSHKLGEKTFSSPNVRNDRSPSDGRLHELEDERVGALMGYWPDFGRFHGVYRNLFEWFLPSL